MHKNIKSSLMVKLTTMLKTVDDLKVHVASLESLFETYDSASFKFGPPGRRRKVDYFRGSVFGSTTNGRKNDETACPKTNTTNDNLNKTITTNANQHIKYHIFEIVVTYDDAYAKLWRYKGQGPGLGVHFLSQSVSRTASLKKSFTKQVGDIAPESLGCPLFCFLPGTVKRTPRIKTAQELRQRAWDCPLRGCTGNISNWFFSVFTRYFVTVRFRSEGTPREPQE
jgi:hypothetical protein